MKKKEAEDDVDDW